jgi:hypothetical protein
MIDATEHEPDGPALRCTILEFEAPYLEATLTRKGVVETAEQAAALFRELKRYLFLAKHQRNALPMRSTLVDAAWHQFVLHTAEYAEFCGQRCGGYLHHVPQGDRPDAAAVEVLSNEAFGELYARHFGPLPDVWYNERCLRPQTRLARCDPHERFHVELHADRAALVRERVQPELVCRTNLRAAPALEFIARHPMFLVRELGGLRGDPERVTLLAPLVEFGILEIAP